MFKEELSKLGARPINQSYDENETVKRCRFCGYQVTDQEKEERGKIHKGLYGSILAEYHSCVFCPEIPWHHPGNTPEVSRWERFKRFFSADQRISWQIHKLKIAIREAVFSTAQFKRLKARKDLLEKDFADQVFNAPYRSDVAGNKILNSHQIEHEKVCDELRELAQIPRQAYYDSLGKLGVSWDDEAPSTRKFDLRQKKKLSRLLQQKLAQLEAYRASGFYD